MKKFKFNLETVLKYREMIEEHEKNKLAELNAEMFRLVSELEQLQRFYRSEVSEFEQVSQNGVKIQELLGKQVIIQNTEYAIKNKQTEIKEQQKLINRQMAVVVRATQDKKTVEKLKEKSFKKYEKSVAKENEIFINEYVSYQSHIADLKVYK